MQGFVIVHETPQKLDTMKQLLFELKPPKYLGSSKTQILKDSYPSYFWSNKKVGSISKKSRNIFTVSVQALQVFQHDMESNKEWN